MVQNPWWGRVIPETIEDLQEAIVQSDDLQGWQRAILISAIRGACRLGTIKSPKCFVSVETIGHMLIRLHEDFKRDRHTGQMPRTENVALVIGASMAAGKDVNVIECCLRLFEQLWNAVDPTYRGR